MAEGWAPLRGGEGLWLARFRDWGGLRLSLSPRLWLPLLRPLRLAPCRELERDLSWDKRYVSSLNNNNKKNPTEAEESNLVRLCDEYRLLSRSRSLALSRSLDRDRVRSRLLRDPAPPLPPEYDRERRLDRERVRDRRPSLAPRPCRLCREREDKREEDRDEELEEEERLEDDLRLLGKQKQADSVTRLAQLLSCLHTVLRTLTVICRIYEAI